MVDTEYKCAVPEELIRMLKKNEVIAYSEITKVTEPFIKNAYEIISQLVEKNLIVNGNGRVFKVTDDKEKIEKSLIRINPWNRDWTYKEFTELVPEIDNPVYSNILIQLDEMGTAGINDIIKKIGHCAQFKLLENRGVIEYGLDGYRSLISADQLRYFLEIRENKSETGDLPNEFESDQWLSSDLIGEALDDLFDDEEDEWSDIGRDLSHLEGFEFDGESDDADIAEGDSDDEFLRKVDKKMAELMNDCREKEEMKEQAVEKYAILRKEGWDKIRYTHFGEYPQSEVLNPDILKALRKKAGKLPTSKESSGWKPYGYKTSATDDVNRWWYKDVEIDFKKYRGVYFTAGREYDKAEYLDDEIENYPSGKIYWFTFKPIRWRVIKETEDVAILFCDMVIDAQPFDAPGNKKKSGENINNWVDSSIRKWLNSTFMNTAFSQGFRDMMVPLGVPTLDCDGVCEITEDCVFLLDGEDIRNREYGFHPDLHETDYMRKIFATDYAVCKGLVAVPELESEKDGTWWLRTPSSIKGHVEVVSSDGAVIFCTDAHNTTVGVVPAIVIKKIQG